MKNCLSPFDDLKTKLIKGEFVLNTLYDEITSYTLYNDLNLNDSNKIFVILRRKNGKDIVIAYNKKITLIHTTMSITH